MEPTGTELQPPSAGAPTTLLGALLDDRYRLDSVIARGGMATVFLATDTRLDRAVAVKVMHRSLAEDPEFVARFSREAKSAARLSAAEVVAVHDYGTDRTTGLAYLVMEHVRGINLRQLIVDRGALPPARAVSLMEPVLRALAAAHSAGLVHRDIKPENVLLADDGRVKVADFGLARAVETSNLTQTTGLLIGTVAYLAPEQVESGTADARTDVYAAGVLLWELLTGTPPYSADSPLSVAYKHVHEDMPAPSTVAAGIPPALDALVVRATRRDPAARPADGGAFLSQLRDVARALPAQSGPAPADHPTLVVARPLQTDPATEPAAPRRRLRRRPLVATALLLVLALLAVGTGFYLGSYRYTSTPAVVALTLTAADAALQKQGLTVGERKEEFSEELDRGLVLRQDPEPGDRIRKGGAVTVVVSLGPDLRVVPALRGLPLPEAQQRLKAAGLGDVEVKREHSSSVRTGLVIRSDPASGEKLKRGSPVTLFVSRGPQPVSVPNVTGRPAADATAALKRLGFEVAVTRAFSDTARAGVVMDQRPSSGTAPRGSTIALTVSKGPDVVTVPNVRGERVADAVQTLEDLDFKTDVRRLAGGPGRVVETRPKAGSRVKRGSTVVLFVF